MGGCLKNRLFQPPFSNAYFKCYSNTINALRTLSSFKMLWPFIKHRCMSLTFNLEKKEEWYVRTTYISLNVYISTTSEVYGELKASKIV